MDRDLDPEPAPDPHVPAAFARGGAAAWHVEGQGMAGPLTYGSYLRIDELLALQQLQSNPPQHDEMLFIVIHQVYELWFKQMLVELEAARDHLDADDPLRTARALARVHAIQHVLEQQVDVLETMTPHEFNKFRTLLNPASGFQSAQFREIEFLCGVEETERVRLSSIWSTTTNIDAPVSNAGCTNRPSTTH